MEEMRTINLDKYDYRLILNALNEFRNKLIAEDRDTTVVDELLLKVLDTPLKKRMFPKHYVEER